MQSITHIKVALGAIDDLLARLDQDLNAASVAAIRNPEVGESKIAEIQKRIGIERAKRDALANELDVARRRAYAANLDAEAAERQRHIEVARESAKRVVAVAGQVDQAVASFKALLGELAEAEAATLAALRAADVALSISVPGQQGIMSTAWARMKVALDGGDRFANSRPRDVADVARVAWRDLIDGEWPDGD